MHGRSRSCSPRPAPAPLGSSRVFVFGVAQAFHLPSGIDHNNSEPLGSADLRATSPPVNLWTLTTSTGWCQEPHLPAHYCAFNSRLDRI